MPRIRHENGVSPTGIINLESGFPYESIRDLMHMKHQIGYGFERYGTCYPLNYSNKNEWI